MLSRADFLGKYKIDEETFNKAGIEWSEIEEIYRNYEILKPTLEPTAKSIVECFYIVSNVHSVRYRIKDVEHLIEKIIRKRSEGRDINLQNYASEITDLIGVRVLHLFKEDWEGIHDFITSEWTLKEDPQANIRKGDSEILNNKFQEKGCEIKIHSAGYRSVHYLIVTNLTKKQHISEIQVRTIFEEAWSEIDHKIRYPYNTDNKMVTEYLEIFNRLSGSADEMGSFIRGLTKGLLLDTREHEETLKEKETVIERLQHENEDLRIQLARVEKEKEELNQISFEEQEDELTDSLGIKDLKEFLHSSTNVAELTDIAERAGFEIDHSDNKASLVDLKTTASILGISDVEEIESILISNLPNVYDFYKAQLSANGGGWTTTPAFNVILLLIGAFYDHFDADILIKKLDWSTAVAIKVVETNEEYFGGFA